MREILIGLIAASALLGCDMTMRRPILLCPTACDQSKTEWRSLRECLYKEKGEYSVTDSTGHPVELYRYRSDAGLFPGIFETQFTVSEESSSDISTPIIFKRTRGSIVIHVKRSETVTSIPLASAKIEHYGKYEVLHIN